MVVCRGVAPRKEAEQRNQEVLAWLLPQRATTSIGVRWDGAVAFGLAGHRQDLADEALRRWPTGLRIRLGHFAYPDPTAEPAPCANLQPGAEGLPAHRWQVPTVRAHVGGEVSTALTLTTGAARGIDVTGGSEAVVTRRGSLTVVASSVLATSTLGLSMHVAPRRSGRWAVTEMSFDSCDPALGSTLPPGRYEIRMNVRIDGRIALTPAIPLTIVA